MADDDTLTMDKMLDAIRSLGDPVPDFIVSVYVPNPLEYRGTIWLTPENAKELHAKSPLILRQMLSPTMGRYSSASPFDGPFPVELQVPPFRTTAEHLKILAEHKEILNTLKKKDETP